MENKYSPHFFKAVLNKDLTGGTYAASITLQLKSNCLGIYFTFFNFFDVNQNNLPFFMCAIYFGFQKVYILQGYIVRV